MCNLLNDDYMLKNCTPPPKKYRLISNNKSYDDIESEGREYEILNVVIGLFQKIP